MVHQKPINSTIFLHTAQSAAIQSLPHSELQRTSERTKILCMYNALHTIYHNFISIGWDGQIRIPLILMMMVKILVSLLYLSSLILQDFLVYMINVRDLQCLGGWKTFFRCSSQSFFVFFLYINKYPFQSIPRIPQLRSILNILFPFTMKCVVVHMIFKL